MTQKKLFGSVSVTIKIKSSKTENVGKKKKNCPPNMTILTFTDYEVTINHYKCS